MKPINERLERIESEEPVTIPGADGSTRTITVKVPAWRDPKDGEIYLDAEAIALIDKTRARYLGVLAPQELARLRERLGLTPRQIALQLQVDEQTWTLWESGREIPPRAVCLPVVPS
jgi:DNA-binding XRE family transcriptional regulator